MSSLKRLQQQFIASLTQQAIQQEQTDFLQQLKPIGQLSNQACVQIYRNNIMASHVNVLMMIFPVVCQIVGEKLFAQWARDYHDKSCTSCADLNAYGKYLPEFIQQQLIQSPQLQAYGYLADLATLEYYWHQAYYAKDDPVFDFNQFEKLATQPDRIFFTTSHALHLIETNVPIFTIWKNHQTQQHMGAVASLVNKETLCIYRYNNEALIETIEHDIYHLLLKCKNHSLAVLAADKTLANALIQLPTLIEKMWITGVKQDAG